MILPERIPSAKEEPLTYSPTFGFHDSMRERYAAKDWDDRVVVQSNSPALRGQVSD